MNLNFITLVYFLKLVVDGRTDRPTDMCTYRAAIAAKNIARQMKIPAHSKSGANCRVMRCLTTRYIMIWESQQMWLSY